MTYTTLAALSARYGTELLVQITDHAAVPTGAVNVATVDQELASTDAVIDAALAVRYRLPLAAVPPVVADIARAIAIYKLHRFSPETKIKDDYDQALKDLDAIATGKRRLDLAGIEPATSGSGRVMTMDRERPLTPESMHGLI